MERSEGAFQAFDGVELRLLNGRVVRVPAFTVAETVRYSRLLVKVKEEGDVLAHQAFVTEFPVRAEIMDVPLADLGFELALEGHPVVTGDGLTVSGAIALLELLRAAQGAEGFDAQVSFLAQFPEAVGLPGLELAGVFPAGRAFAGKVYDTLYGLAKDFLYHLVSTPRVQVMEIRATALGASSFTTASTT